MQAFTDGRVGRTGFLCIARGRSIKNLISHMVWFASVRIRHHHRHHSPLLIAIENRNSKDWTMASNEHGVSLPTRPMVHHTHSELTMCLWCDMRPTFNRPVINITFTYYSTIVGRAGAYISNSAFKTPFQCTVIRFVCIHFPFAHFFGTPNNNNINV